MKEKKEYFYDLHCHTLVSIDSPTKLKEIIKVAKKRGLDGIAVTDHNKAYKGPLLINEIQIIPGSEVTLKNKGHLLCYFIEKDIPKNLELKDAVSEIKKQKGYAVLAHPFRKKHGHLKNASEKEKKEALILIDGLEVVNASDSSKINNLTKKLKEKHFKTPLFATAGSDSHMAGQVGFGVVKTKEKLDQKNFARILEKAEPIVIPESDKFRGTAPFWKGILFIVERILELRWMEKIKPLFYILILRNFLRLKNKSLSRVKFNFKK